MLVDTHGVAIGTRWWLIDEPRALVLIAHGASEHAGRYDRFATALNAAGIAAVGIDHRGHGRTSAATGVGLMGAGGGGAVVDDLDELRAAASTRVGADIPVVLFGHSMGSLIALAYLANHSEGLAGAVLCGIPADVNDVTALAELLDGVAAAGMRDQPASELLGQNNAAFEPARTPFDWLSRDPDEVDRYLADPFCGDQHPLTYGYLIDLFTVVAPVRDHLHEITCPVFVIAGDHDPAAAMGRNATTLAEALAGASVHVDRSLYEDARHELLNESNRDEVTADVIAWIDTQLSRT